MTADFSARRRTVRGFLRGVGMEDLIARLEALLDELDELNPTEALADLNATLEDVIFLLTEDEEAGTDAQAELADLAAAYGKCGLQAHAARLKAIAREIR